MPRLSQLPNTTPVAGGDLVPFTDVSDTSASPQGTTKRTTLTRIRDWLIGTGEGQAAGIDDLASTDAGKGAELVAKGTLHVDSVSALRARSFPAVVDHIWLDGYYGAGTAGGGMLYRDSDDDSTADNGGTVFVDDAGVRWKRTEEGYVDAHWFGVLHDGTGDQRERFNAFLTAGAGGVCVFGPGVVRVDGSGSLRLDMIGASFSGTTLRGRGGRWGSAIRPAWNGNDQFPDILRVQDCEDITLENFWVDGVEWFESELDPDERTANQWARINPRDVDRITMRSLGARHVGNMLQMNGVTNYTIDDIYADDAFLIVHLLPGTHTGTISNLIGTRITGSAIDWGGGGGQNTTVTNVFASSVGAFRRTDEMFDMGGARDVLVSNCIGIGFNEGVTLKGESGATFGNVRFENAHFLECLRRGASIVVGSEPAGGGFGDVAFTNCTLSQTDGVDKGDPAGDASAAGFIRISPLANSSVVFTNCNINNEEQEHDAIRYSMGLKYIIVSDCTITTKGGGVQSHVSTGLAPGGTVIIRGNEILCENLSNNRNGITASGTTVAPMVEGNKVTGNPSIGIECAVVPWARVVRNVIKNARSHGMAIGVRDDVSSFAGAVDNLLPSGRRLGYLVSDNEIRNWGQSSTFRAAIIVSLSNVGSDAIVGGKIEGNQAFVDEGKINSQDFLSITGASDDQLSYWWFAGNLSNRNVPGAVAARFDTNSKIDNLINVD